MNLQNKSTFLFICALFLGGICHVLETLNASDNILNTIFFCLNLIIYSGLIIFWLRSVRKRLLPTRARNYMLLSGMLMLLFLLVRAAKYRLVKWSVPMTRLCWYLFYIPIILIPTLFLMISLDFGNTAAKQSWIRRYLPIPALLLIFGFLTNDLHHLAFEVQDVTSLYRRELEYNHNVLYYAGLIWISGMMTAGVVHLIAVSRNASNWKQAIRPFLYLMLIPVFLALKELLEFFNLPLLYLMPEIIIFCMLGVQENCIRNRLLPHNENYEAFFGKLDLPLILTDTQLEPVYQTAIPVTSDKEHLRQAVGASVYPDPDTRLSGMSLPAGYAFFTEDESTLNSLNEELRDANEVLALENELLAREQELIAEKAAIEERSQLYTKAAKAVYPAQKRISDILEKAVPDTPAFRKDIAKALVITAFVKRKANFVMLSAERDYLTIEEIASALKESAHYLGYCGIHATVSITTSSDFPCEAAMKLYECFEAIAETLCGKTDEIWIRLSETELRVLADTEQMPVFPPLSLPVTSEHEDGQAIIRIPAGGDVP